MPNYNAQTDPTQPVQITSASDAMSGIYTLANATENPAWVKHSPLATPSLPASVAECLSDNWFPLGTASAPIQCQLGSGNPVDPSALWIIEEPGSADRAWVCSIGI